MSNYAQLKDVLNDLFELNKADLDFGIYRIINQKRKQVNDFIEKQLPEDIKTALSNTQSVDKAEVEKELKTLKKNLEDAGVVAEDSPKYKTLHERLQSLENTGVLEQEVFSHLANFFRRYYNDGDFISMRRYKKDVYAIPYEGEEVKLHWANYDQYYIKSSENFKQYSFTAPDSKKVTFQLKEVSTEQNNNKIQGDAERRFALFAELPVEETEAELFINFIYEPFPKTTKQDTLIVEALDVLTTRIPQRYSSIFTLHNPEKSKTRTLLEKHLFDYVAKNSFDYFIHKDLGGFLSRELDFYIKNEVLYIDDINVKQTDFFVAQLSKVKAIKVVAQKIIDFLAQIENFQKKLWLKKKFIIRTDYCITIDKIPSSYYQEIVQNKAQLEEWERLFDINIQDEAQLAFEQFLVLDTKFFDAGFKDRLLSEFDNLDEQTNGLLINSENFQALGVLQEKYLQLIDVTYIDPPYNAKSSEIIYKNSFKHSSWLSLMENRLTISKTLNNEIGVHIIAIDEVENFNLGKMAEDIFNDHENSTISIVHNPTGQQGNNLSYTHEFAHFIFPAGKDVIGLEDRNDSNRESKPDIRPLRNVSSGKNHLRESAANCFYPILVKEDRIYGFGDVCDDDFHPGSINIRKEDGIIEIYPIDPSGVESKWVFARDTVESILDELTVKYDSKRKIYDIIRTKAKFRYKSLWSDTRYSANSWGSVILNNIIENCPFQYPKSIFTVTDCIDAGLSNRSHGNILDYFSGSGTTAHATIKLNREDKGNRKYILVEMGAYFDTVTKPRIQKVTYSDNWKNGKPQDKAGISQIIKYQLLESYEDTLNNLYLQPSISQTELELNQKAQEEYLLQYMLEIESRDHLFNLDMFRKPFDYQLKITENNELKPTKVDLVETFNYLIGLYVNKIQRVKDIKVVEGITRTGIKTLVIWRDIETTTNEEVEKLIRRFYDSQRTKEFQQIFINGDHHLENLRQEGDQFKIKLIEETFFKKMFNETEL